MWMNETVRFQVMANNSLDLALETHWALLLAEWDPTHENSMSNRAGEAEVKGKL